MFSPDDLDAIQNAIKTFETSTSGEIVVSFHTSSVGQPYKTARRIFAKHNLHKTKARNATLIVLYPGEQKFAIVGDEGIHAKVPENFWDEVVEKMTTHFKAGEMLAGVIAGINLLGEKLAEFFPYQDTDVNEISDAFRYDDNPDAASKEE
ncbi:MAG: TPM domain-containing protein [Candidatus Marinimicrobia bacterium]|nr:TPM domain-containing protein [Candidatus Neomarinimicrobiota bacterium]MCF7902754.1 TPM domain-containing protein [Candidatus Neomarinimicrobiota bacterium]